MLLYFCHKRTNPLSPLSLTSFLNIPWTVFSAKENAGKAKGAEAGAKKKWYDLLLYNDSNNNNNMVKLFFTANKKIFTNFSLPSLFCDYPIMHLESGWYFFTQIKTSIVVQSHFNWF